MTIKSRFETAYRASSDTLHQRVDDGILLIHLSTNHAYALNPTASAFWQLLMDGQTPARATMRLASDHNVDANQLESEATSLLDQLLENQLICEQGSG